MLGWGGLGGDVCQARCRIQGQAGCDDRAVLGGLLGAVVQLCLELGAVGLTSPPGCILRVFVTEVPHTLAFSFHV